MQQSCTFLFNDIVTDANAARTEFGLQCLDNSGTAVTHIPLIQTYFNVTYRCDGSRQRFRPFSNKRYDSSLCLNVNCASINATFRGEAMLGTRLSIRNYAKSQLGNILGKYLRILRIFLNI